MGLILSLETSTQVCSAALHENGRLLITNEVHVEHSHASKLACLVDSMLKVTERRPGQLEAVAVSAGPGSYTGLRIGASTAKGLSFGLEIPLISVGTLELMAFQMRSYNTSQGFMCPMIDARRMEVYCLIMNEEMERVSPVEAKIVDADSFLEFLNSRTVTFFGDGASKCKEVITHKNARFVEGVYPRASSLGEIAHQYRMSQKFEDVTRFEPYYVKAFEAKKSKALI